MRQLTCLAPYWSRSSWFGTQWSSPATRSNCYYWSWYPDHCHHTRSLLHLLNISLVYAHNRGAKPKERSNSYLRRVFSGRRIDSEQSLQYVVCDVGARLFMHGIDLFLLIQEEVEVCKADTAYRGRQQGCHSTWGMKGPFSSVCDTWTWNALGQTGALLLQPPQPPLQAVSGKGHSFANLLFETELKKCFGCPHPAFFIAY